MDYLTKFNWKLNLIYAYPTLSLLLSDSMTSTYVSRSQPNTFRLG